MDLPLAFVRTAPSLHYPEHAPGPLDQAAGKWLAFGDDADRRADGATLSSGDDVAFPDLTFAGCRRGQGRLLDSRGL